MTARSVPAQAGLLVAGSVAVLLASWVWRGAIVRTPAPQAPKEPWQHVRDQFPLPKDPEDPQRLSKEAVETVVQANPFSPDRGKQPIVPGGPDGSEATGEAVVETPTFAYKGRISLGQRQRAILEHLQTKKTHFLEVGQEVAGFKLLDIQETRVILSDPKSHEELIVSLTSKGKP